MCRWFYNRLLEELNKAKKKGKKLTKKETQAFIVRLKKEKPELKEVHSKVLQMVNYTLWSNIFALSKLKKNKKKIGRLRFKGKYWYKSLNLNQTGFKINPKEKKIKLSKLGSINAKLHRKIDGEVKGIIIKKENTGKWFAVVQIEKKHKKLKKTNKKVGIDLGITKFIVDSDKNKIENPKFISNSLEKLKTIQKQLSKKKKRSKNRKKAKLKLEKVHEKIENQRKDYLHKISRFYVNNYDELVVEDLNVKELSRLGKQKGLHRNILDASWTTFTHMLSYKAESAGRRVVKVNPRGTTQNCSSCGIKVPKKLKDRVHNCPNCGLIADRDYNASINILNAGLGQPKVPVEKKPLFRDISYKEIVSGQVFSMKQEAPCG